MKWQDPVSQRGVLLICSQITHRVGDPSDWQTYKPFHELRRRTWPSVLVQNCGGRGAASGDVLPSCDGVGVSPPATKMLSTSANRVSAAFELMVEPTTQTVWIRGGLSESGLSGTLAPEEQELLLENLPDFFAASCSGTR